VKRSLVSLAAALVAAACVSTPAPRVPDAQGVESVSAIMMSCKKPFALKHDCSGVSGPKKEIVVGGQDLKVAGNADGTVTVMFGETDANATQSSNLGYELMKRELVSRGFEIVAVTPIESGGLMYGYAIETTEPSYAIWDEFAK
jgi:hypothetical protein